MSDYTNEANYKEFVAVLTEQMELLLAPMPGWIERIIAAHGSVETFAHVFTALVINGRADNNGTAVKAACKFLKIKNTYKAINAYLTGTFKVQS